MAITETSVRIVIQPLVLKDTPSCGTFEDGAKPRGRDDIVNSPPPHRTYCAHAHLMRIENDKMSQLFWKAVGNIYRI